MRIRPVPAFLVLMSYLPGTAGQGLARRGVARLGEAGPGTAGHGMEAHNQVRYQGSSAALVLGPVPERKAPGEAKASGHYPADHA